MSPKKIINSMTKRSGASLCYWHGGKRGSARYLVLALVMFMLSCAQPSTVIEDLVTDLSPLQNFGSADGVTGTPEFEGALTYANNNVFQVPVNESRVFHPLSRITLDSADTRDESIIHYELVAVDEDAFEPPPTINNNGFITVKPNTTTGGPKAYKLHVTADGYETREVDLTLEITPEDANAFRINVYHHGDNETSTIAVGLGQAIKDGTSSFSLSDSDEALKISNLTVGSEYVLHFGESAGNYNINISTIFIADSTESIVVSKSELANLPNISGAAVGISGPGITGIVLVATYQPSNIYNHQDLQSMRHNLGGNYVLQKDIVFTIPSGATVSNFEAVGNIGSPFTGTFDGVGYSISNLQIYNPDVIRGKYQGLFGIIAAADATDLAVQNLELRDFRITGYTYVGSLVGLIRRGTVHAVAARVSGPDMGKVVVDSNQGNHGYGGGLLGYAGTDTSGTQVTIQNSSSETKVTGSGDNTDYLGGLVGAGTRDMMITHSYATGNVNGTNFVGGLVGHNDYGTVSGYATGNVNGTNFVGGLVGENNGGTVSGYARGNVNGTGESVGGLVGHNDYGTVTGYAIGNVTGTGESVGGLVGRNVGTVTGYATGDVSGSSSYVGGLVGRNSGTVSGYARSVVRRVSGTSDAFGNTIGSDNAGTNTIYSSLTESRIYDGQTGTTEFTDSRSGLDGTLRRVTRLTIQRTFDDDDDGLIFGTDIGQWTWVSDGRWPAINIGDVAPVEEQPTEPAPEVEIRSVSDFRNIKDNPESIYKLMNNIVWEGEFEPIPEFSGVFEGQGNSITGIRFNTRSRSNAGLFGTVLEGAVIKDLSLIDCAFTGGQLVGSIAGTNEGRIENVHSSCVVTGSGDYVGGLVGSNGSSGTVSGYAIGEVHGNTWVGGLVGTNLGTVYGYARGTVSGGDSVGGLVGGNSGTVSGYATGTVIGSASSVGALVGANYGSVIGYARGIVRRISGTDTSYGKTIGNAETGSTSTTYSSTTESKIYDGETGTSELTGTTGIDGTAVSISSTTTTAMIELTFPEFTFDVAIGKWTSVDGRWPAINIGDVALVEEQPTEHSVVEIESASDFRNKVDNLEGYYKLMNDIVWEGEFEPIPDFNGEFDGQGYSIGNISFNSEDDNVNVGLFGAVSKGAVVKDLSLIDCEFTGGQFVGSIAGRNFGSIQNVHSSCNVSKSGNGVGGLVGQNHGTVSGYATGEVTGDDFLGGLVGYNYNGTVTGYARGTVTGDDVLGGLVGYNYDGTVTGYARGTVSGSGDSVGGLVGRNTNDGTVSGYARGIVRRISGTDASYGKTIGNAETGSTITTYSSTTESKIYDGETGTSRLTGTTAIDGTAVFVTSTTTTAMIESTFTGFTFGTAIGEWTSVDGKWPAINIGDVAPVGEQPTEPDPEVKIRSASDLRNIEDNPGWNYKLMNDIVWEGEFEPIPEFSGEFDGQGFSITGIRFNSESRNNVGLFGTVSEGAVVTDLSLIDCAFTGGQYVGSLAGTNYGRIENVQSSCVVTGSGGSVGGLVGRNYGTVSGYATRDVTGGSYVGSFVGGLVGRNGGAVTGYATGNVNGTNFVGGLVGYNNDGSVSGYAIGNVTGRYDYVGGLIGTNSGNVTGYATGNVDGYAYAGGLVGRNVGTVSGYATGTVSGSSSYVGGLVGRNINGGTVIGYARGIVRRTSGTYTSYGRTIGNAETGSTSTTYSSITESKIYDGETGTSELTGTTAIDGIAVSISSSTTTTMIESTFPEFTFGTAIGEWTRVAGKWPAINIGDVALVEEQPTEHSVVEIESASDFRNKVDNLEGYYKLMNDIVWEGEFEPIPDFNGEFDGQGYSIGNISFNSEDDNVNVGLFGAVSKGAVVKDLSLIDCEFTGGQFVGSIAGRNFGSIQNVHSSCNVSKSGNGVGGLVGQNHGTVSGYATGEVTGYDFLGGLVGYNYNGTVTGYARGTVTGDDVLGGLVGYNYNGTVTGYARGTVSGSGDSVGGLVGRNYSGGTVSGYARGIVRRISGTNTSYGKTIGSESTNATSTTYSSTTESKIYDGETGTSELTGTTGLDGTAVSITITTTTTMIESTFTGFTFGTAIGEWTSVAGKWPAFNIGDVAPVGEQPTEPDPELEGEIRNVFDFKRIKDNPESNYKLMNDIVWEGEFEPIPEFSGEFDGQGYSIGNINFNSEDDNNVGLFGRVLEGAVVKDLSLIDCAFTGGSYVGSIAGRNYGSIQNVHSSCDVTGSGHDVGGLVGSNGSSGTVSGYARGTVTGSGSVGGLAGRNDARLSGYATGTVSGSGSVGGLVGFNSSSGTVSGYARGTVTGSYSVGGLVGVNDGTVSGYARGNVTGNNYVGGLVGVNFSDGTVSGYATGTVSGSGNYVGGLVGENNGGTVSGYARGIIRRTSGTSTSFGKTIGRESTDATSTTYSSRTESRVYDGETGTSELTGRAGIDGTAVSITSTTTTAMIQSTFNGFTFGTAIGEWTSAAGNWPAINLGEIAPVEEQPTEPSVVEIRSASDFRNIRDNLEGYYILMNDIVWEGEFEPILVFRGEFYGQGFSIGNISLNSEDDNVGLFGTVSEGAVVTDLSLIDCEFTEGSDSVFSTVGSLAGTNNGRIENVHSSCVVTGDYNVGGLVGINYGTVVGYATGVVSGDYYVGGLVGKNRGTVTGYARVTVSGSGNDVGGLVGSNGSSGTVSGYATGEVHGNSWVGGLVGYNSSGGTVSGYATGTVSGSGNYVGGLVGSNSNRGTVSGYARGIIRRTSGTSTRFGKTIGDEYTGATSITYNSTTESRVYDGETGTSELTGRAGIDGTAVSITSTTTTAIIQSTFTGFTFGTAIGEWTSVAGKWPAINIGDVAPVGEQPIE